MFGDDSLLAERFYMSFFFFFEIRMIFHDIHTNQLLTFGCYSSLDFGEKPACCRTRKQGKAPAE